MASYYWLALSLFCIRWGPLVLSSWKGGLILVVSFIGKNPWCYFLPTDVETGRTIAIVFLLSSQAFCHIVEPPTSIFIILPLPRPASPTFHADFSWLSFSLSLCAFVFYFLLGGAALRDWCLRALGLWNDCCLCRFGLPLCCFELGQIASSAYWHSLFAVWPTQICVAAGGSSPAQISGLAKNLEIGLKHSRGYWMGMEWIASFGI